MKKMGLFEMLLGEEEAKKIRSAYKGRDAEIPAHMMSGDYSMAFQGHPYMQMPGAMGLLGGLEIGDSMIGIDKSRMGEETVAPWDERITEEPYMQGDTFLQEGGPYYREGMNPNPNIPPEVRIPPQMPWDQQAAPQIPLAQQVIPPTNQGRPQPAPEYPIPPQHIAGAVTNVDPRMEAMRQMQAMQEMQAMQAMQGIPNSAMQGFVPPMDVAAMPNSAMQGFVPMGGAY